jgi:uncharacterized FAD-dependent dehydrogenase
MSKETLPVLVAEKCRLKRFGVTLSHWSISKESLDARDKSDIRFVYSIDFSIAGNKRGVISEEQLVSELKRLDAGVKASVVANVRTEIAKPPEPLPASTAAPCARSVASTVPPIAPSASPLPPLIAGFGPCGMFAGLALAEMGLNPIILERGKAVEERVVDVERFWKGGALDPDSNVQFGEGGAGTFSDGKLATGIGDPRRQWVLEQLARAGGGKDILYKQRPHIGTDRLRAVVRNIRERIISLGGSVMFCHRLDGLLIEESSDGARRLRGVVVNGPDGKNEMPASRLALAVGHSARDTFATLFDAGLRMSSKPFSIGLRIEHRQSLINLAQYGEAFASIYGMTPEAAGLPAAEYRLSCKSSDGRGVYTFCMCPGGVVVAATSHPGMTVTNGMSYSGRDGAFANSAVLVDVRVTDFASAHPLAGMTFQEEYERRAFALARGYAPPRESVEDFMSGTGALARCLPEFAARGIREGLKIFGNRLKGFDTPEAWLYGVETRSSSPVRIFRDATTMMSNIEGVFPGGEGAGWAGGIMSAAVDGMRLADGIARASE